MTISGKKIAITGASRGLGAALATIAADRGAIPILLGRQPFALEDTALAIEARCGVRPDAFVCDLADTHSVASAADKLSSIHPDIDILVNNGSYWVGGAFEAINDAELHAIIGSTVTGTMALTRHLLPLLSTRPQADIHTVVSMSGLQYARLRGSSLPFRAAKAAQDGFVQGLVEELADSRIRVTSVYPGIIEDISPLDAAWNEERGPEDRLTNKDVVEAILFALSAPPNVAIRSLVIERARSEFLG